MNEWLLVIAASLFGSLFSLVGGVLLLTKRLSISKVQLFAVPFAAGALLAAALLDLLPEALEGDIAVMNVMVYLLAGFVVFFVLERFLGWFHHHHQHGEETIALGRRKRSMRSLVVIGDTIHNAIDGMVIGAAFLADPTVGVITTIAIAAHEIPQEIGDFGLLLSFGMSRRLVLLVNIFSALATVVGAALVFGLGSELHSIQPILLAVASGMFIYIAASDLIPTIHEEPSTRLANYQTAVLLFGVVFVGLTTTLLHQYVGTPHEPHATSEVHGQ